jgi:lipopolysaccharide transport system ATP-binding protein
VLAVGDAAFQKKCLGKLEEGAKEGRTVLFVSHNMAAVEHLCNRGILLEHGNIELMGSAKETIEHYLMSELNGQKSAQAHVVDLAELPRRSPRSCRILKRLELFTEENKPVNGSLKIGASLKVYLHMRLEQPTSALDALLGFDSLLGQRILTLSTAFQPNRANGLWIGEHTFICDIPSLPLVPGEYKLVVSGVTSTLGEDKVEDAARLTIIESDYYRTGRVPWKGFFVLTHHWTNHEG